MKNRKKKNNAEKLLRGACEGNVVFEFRVFFSQLIVLFCVYKSINNNNAKTKTNVRILQESTLEFSG